MARSDVRTLRADASAAAAQGKHRKALTCYLELEGLEPGDPNWPKRAAEVYRRLGKTRDAVAAYDRAVDRYAQRGFLVQAIAVCKVILQLDPGHESTKSRLARITALKESAGTRVDALTGRHRAIPDLAGPGERPPLTAPSRATSGAPTVTAEPIAVGGTSASDRAARRKVSSGPLVLDPGAPLDSVALAGVVGGAQRERRDDGSASGIVVIPIDDDDPTAEIPAVEIQATRVDDHDTGPRVRFELDDDDEPPEELTLQDIEEVVELARPTGFSVAARRALAATPLFAGLAPAALEDLIERLELLDLDAGQVLFEQGAPGSALYVVVEGQVAVTSDGVEMTRLGASAFFGEVALVTEQPRTATITATEPTQLLVIDRAVIRALVADHPEVLLVILRFLRDRLLDRLVQTHPLFTPHADAERRYLASLFRFVEIEAGTAVIEQGHRPVGLFVLLAGRVEVDHDGVAVASLEPGDVFGETALLTNQPCAVTITAGQRCLALCMQADAFRHVIMTHPLVLSYIGELVEQRRRTLDRALLDPNRVDLV